MGDFRERKAWQHARTLVVLTKSAIAQLPETERAALADQWRRATYSVAPHLTEARNPPGGFWPRRWLLLCQAVDRSQSPHQIRRVNSYDRPIRDQLREHAERRAVLRIVEGRHQDGPVRDVEVRVARGETLPGEIERSGHREVDHLDLATVFESHPLQALAIFLERPIVRIVPIGLPAHDDRARIDEAAQVVDVPVRVVARDPGPEPQDVRGAELVTQDRLDLPTPEPRVSDLHRGIEQALLGGEQSAATVHIDAAAFEHDVGSAGARTKQSHVELRGRGRRTAGMHLKVAVTVRRAAVERSAY